jgi:FkbM family methyltransferase
MKQPPCDKKVYLRNGHVIYLSDDPNDIVTVFLIFAREDYGKIESGAVVIDIGANIGVFALFAAFSGAKAVYAFEPSQSSYDVLLNNISANKLNTIIHAERYAVVGLPSAPVKFPSKSNVMNAILPDFTDCADCELVPTITLSEMVLNLDKIDLLKLDCEGAEYDFLLQANAVDIRKIVEIRMEYHCGPLDELIARLRDFGYVLRKFMSEEKDGGGYLWLIRKSSK